jgi:hypothetical protein
MNVAEGTVDGYTAEELAATNGGNNKKRAPKVCPSCGKKGHTTTRRSKKCLHHNAPRPGQVTAETVQQGSAASVVTSAPRNSLAQAIEDINEYEQVVPLDDPASDDETASLVPAGDAFSDDGSRDEDQRGII